MFVIRTKNSNYSRDKGANKPRPPPKQRDIARGTTPCPEPVSAVPFVPFVPVPLFVSAVPSAPYVPVQPYGSLVPSAPCVPLPPYGSLVPSASCVPVMPYDPLVPSALCVPFPPYGSLVPNARFSDRLDLFSHTWTKKPCQARAPIARKTQRKGGRVV